MCCMLSSQKQNSINKDSGKKTAIKKPCHYSNGIESEKRKWQHTTKYGDPYLEFVLCAYPSKSAHTQQWVHTHTHTHTVNTHLEQWAAIYAAAGEKLGVQCLAQGHLVMVLKVEKSLYIHSPHLQFMPARDSNLQPLDYESDSLTIRPRLPLMCMFAPTQHSRQDMSCLFMLHFTLVNGQMKIHEA